MIDSSPDQSASALVASEPQDEQAIALVQAMRTAGLRVIFAETANLATRATEATACVVVLRPETWKTQSIAVVMRAKPKCLIPVLAEAMDLPRGPWTHEAISIGDDPAQAQQAVIQALRSYFATQSEPPQKRPSELLTLHAPRKLRGRVNMRLVLTYILILLIIGLGGILGYSYYTRHQTTPPPSFSGTTAPIYATYSTNTPGYRCDNGAGSWATSDRYKKDKKTEVLDQYTTLQCQPNGSLLTRSGDYRTYSEIFFYGPSASSSIAQHSVVQVKAQVVSGDAQARFTLDTHVNEHGYGRYSFHVNTLGHWEAHTNSTDGVSDLNRLAIGFLPDPAQTYILTLETNGPVMTFSINGKQVATVTDTTYTDDDSLAFGIDDPTATSSISALFSDFTYKELSPSTLATSQVFGTATAQANSQSPYTAHIPGYRCDQGKGQWQPLGDTTTPGSLQCTSGGMQLTSPASANGLTEEDFYGLDGHFPPNYQISVQIDVSAAGGGCAGLATRVDQNNNFYVFVICPDGHWEVALVTDAFHSLDQGTVDAKGSYKLAAVASGSMQSLSIDDRQVSSMNNPQLQSTDHVSLLVGFYQSSQQSTATFTDFSFVPLG